MKSSFRDPPRLPVIDLSLFELGDPWRDQVAAQIDWAASELGFFYVIGHGVEPSVIDSLLELSRSFFRLRDEVKLRIHMSRGGSAWRGYFPVGGELTSGRPDLKEGLYFGEELPEEDARVRSGVPLHGRNLFPDMPGFRRATLDYMQALTGLGHRLMSSMGRALRLGDTYFVDRYTGKSDQAVPHLQLSAVAAGVRRVGGWGARGLWLTDSALSGRGRRDFRSSTARVG
jgi:isopenicillin N synthase-like dioxygenase